MQMKRVARSAPQEDLDASMPKPMMRNSSICQHNIFSRPLCHSKCSHTAAGERSARTQLSRCSLSELGAHTEPIAHKETPLAERDAHRELALTQGRCQDNRRSHRAILTGGLHRLRAKNSQRVSQRRHKDAHTNFECRSTTLVDNSTLRAHSSTRLSTNAPPRRLARNRTTLIALASTQD